MPRDSNTLIAELVGSLEPVKPLSFRRGFALALAAAAVSVLGVAAMFDLRPDLLSGRFEPVFLLASGLFLVLGIAASVTVIVMSRPRVGSDHGGWAWAAAMVALLPVAATLVTFGRGGSVLGHDELLYGAECLALGSSYSVLVFAVLVWWLRKGAPTSPERAGLLTGIAAGCFGIFAFSLHCRYDDIVHIGLWHSAVVVVAATAGRALVPRLVRW
ncbi:DUF1109 domain-containing protein [Altererythrobacter sp. H2]|uniref:DUF1109 domain-containing protein n=1 Tax=Altererythrobacter sp. H2 TaxID=3108391 RepID=UPI002B4C02AD|nr:DUF1109 domain-containing protein [Altererythrobacter sp. H2]WRK96712.1 DUF1109 domain-containing protein [Altererythrobacter sp. H2]